MKSWCSNQCLKYGIKKGTKKPYENGLAYCRRCELYFDTNLAHCFCCGMHLRRTKVKYKRVKYID